jgi:ceramide glucosyltransferase
MLPSILGSHVPPALAPIGNALLIAAWAYALLALCATALPLPSGRRRSGGARLPVSVLKPLCGAEPRLYENLRSFCEQDHPCYQIVFGVRFAHDAAIAVVHRLQAQFPKLDLALVIDPRIHGSNPKISNLINLFPAARHDWLVLADADIEVPRDYLSRVTAPLAHHQTGVVTCLYRGRPLGGVWARLGRMFIDDWFAPSVLLTHLFGSRSFGFGATLALRREALAAIGGFESLRNELADDFRLAELLRRKGLQTVLSPLVVSTDVRDASLPELWAHELRWMRTIRAQQPFGFAFTFITFTTPILLFGALLAPHQPATAALLASGLGARLVLHQLQRQRPCSRATLIDYLLLPLRDALSLALWFRALGGRHVYWRGQRLALNATAVRAAHNVPQDLNSTTHS